MKATSAVGAALLLVCGCGVDDDRVPGCDEEVTIAAGTFWMGCNATLDGSCESDESPQHEVALSAFRIDVCEMTVRRYRACIDAGACTEPAVVSPACTSDVAEHAEHPINCVTRAQARASCAWARQGGRLPTEAEWERAARGGCETLSGTCRVAMRTFPWGEASPNCALAVMDDGSGPGCGSDGTQAVASRSEGQSPYGLHDMAGNVWEWTADHYAADRYGGNAVNDPTGPPTGKAFVVRGGRFGGASYKTADLRCSNRDLAEPTFVFEGLGFRCARDAP